MCHALLDVPACYVGYHASTRRQARTDGGGGGGGEKESSVPELCSLESVCGQGRVFTAVLPGVSLPPYSSTALGNKNNNNNSKDQSGKPEKRRKKNTRPTRTQTRDLACHEHWLEHCS